MYRPELSARRFENYEMEAAEMKSSMHNQFQSISDSHRDGDHTVVAQTDNSKFISFNDSQQLKQGQVTTF